MGVALQRETVLSAWRGNQGLDGAWANCRMRPFFPFQPKKVRRSGPGSTFLGGCGKPPELAIHSGSAHPSSASRSTMWAHTTLGTPVFFPDLRDTLSNPVRPAVQGGTKAKTSPASQRGHNLVQHCPGGLGCCVCVLRIPQGNTVGGKGWRRPAEKRVTASVLFHPFLFFR